MIQNNVIRSDDPQAVEKLQAKLDKLTKQQRLLQETRHSAGLSRPFGRGGGQAGRACAKQLFVGKAALSVLYTQRQHSGNAQT
jgi:hypothetical protein